MRVLGVRTVVLHLAVALTVCACSGPTAPSAPSFSGRWQGTYVVTGCEATGGWNVPSSCSQAISTSGVVDLLLGQAGGMVTGRATTGHIDFNAPAGWYHDFQAPIEPDGRVRISTGAGRTPSAVNHSTWDVRRDSSGQLIGTLVIISSWYKVPGSTTRTATFTASRVGGWLGPL